MRKSWAKKYHAASSFGLLLPKGAPHSCVPLSVRGTNRQLNSLKRFVEVLVQNRIDNGRRAASRLLQRLLERHYSRFVNKGGQVGTPKVKEMTFLK